MKPTPKKQNGFTLIEIVIVLAIAALIMVIVFLAIQGAQRSRRDTQRRDAAGQVLAQMENYAGNHSGDYPANQAAFNTQMTTGGYALVGNANNDPLSNSAYQYSGARTPSPTASAGFTYTLSGKQITVCVNLESSAQACFNN